MIIRLSVFELGQQLVLSVEHKQPGGRSVNERFGGGVWSELLGLLVKGLSSNGIEGLLSTGIVMTLDDGVSDALSTLQATADSKYIPNNKHLNSKLLEYIIFLLIPKD